jgi:hypothetical protein
MDEFPSSMTECGASQPAYIVRCHARAIPFLKFREYERENHETGTTENQDLRLLRYYRTFNAEQCDGSRALCGDDRKAANPMECESIANAMPNSHIKLVQVGHPFHAEVSVWARHPPRDTNRFRY